MPFATMFGDKSVLEEQQPSFIGMYDGRLMNPDVRAYVESCDQVVTVGTLMTDFNSGYLLERLLCMPGPRHRLQRSRGMALLRTAPRPRLLRLVHHPPHHLRQAGPGPAPSRP